MADDRSTGVTWFIILVIYFVFFIFIIATVTEFETDVNSLNSSLIPDKNGIALANFESCNAPRYKYNPELLTKEEYKAVGLNNLACEESKGVTSKIECDSIEGCSWTNVTSDSWFSRLIGTATYYSSCSGDINATFYGITTTDPIVGRDYMTQHNNTGAISGFIQRNTPVSGTSNNICLHPEVVYDERNCEMFSCTWGRSEFEINSVGDILSLTGDLFTFDYDFDFENEGLNTLMYFVFLILPFLALMFSIYLMVR